MRKFLAAVGLLLVMGASSARDYAAGQVWTYHVKPGDEGSTLQINKVEQDPKLGPIFHMSVFGLRISNPRVAGGILTELPHLPVSKETLDKSVESLAMPRFGRWHMRRGMLTGNASSMRVTPVYIR